MTTQQIADRITEIWSEASIRVKQSGEMRAATEADLTKEEKKEIEKLTNQIKE